MKIRQGFVSNSSSSSFVICLPDNFDSEKFFEEHKNSDKGYNGRFDEAQLKKEYDEFIESKNLYEVFGRCFHFLRNMFREHIVASSETSSDAGTGVILDNNKLKKIING